MCVYTGVSRRSREILVFPVRYVLVCPRISIFFGKAKVYNVNQISFFAESH